MKPDDANTQITKAASGRVFMSKELLVLYVCLYLSMIGYGIALPVIPFFLQDLAQSHDVGSAGIPF